MRVYRSQTRSVGSMVSFDCAAMVVVMGKSLVTAQLEGRLVRPTGRTNRLRGAWSFETRCSGRAGDESILFYG